MIVHNRNPGWWQRAVFYQIYPRSFADSNGDGVGDLDGVTAHLDYLNDGTPNSLGIDAIWLNPINPSPLDDWGYDISDYCGIHPELGDLAAFDRLVAQAHRRGIRVIVDLVPNHTSNQHPWFVESRASRANPKRDWYIWIPGLPDRPPSNWQSYFGGDAWKYDPATASWYLHTFLEEQPDLNYRNPQVVEAIHDVIRFWLDRGADGFRIDVIQGLIKDDQLRDNPVRAEHDPDIPWYAEGTQDPLYSSDRPEVHEIIRGLRRVTDSYEQRMMVGETWPREQERLADYLRPDELQLAFNFRFLLAHYDARRFRAAIELTEKTFGPGAWPTWTLSNHDFPRHISRYSYDGDGDARARVAAVMIMALRGTPFIYYGEEIGMREAEIPAGRKLDPVGRDGCRSPMQWSGARNGGFSANARTWLPCGDFKAVNVARQLNDPHSMLSLYRRLIQIRKSTPALTEGSYRALDSAPEDCLVFHRDTPAQHIVVALNFTAEPREIDLPAGKIILSTIAAGRAESTKSPLRLGPNEAVIVEAG
ncbi:alpha-amylase family glycosyl hydrolase [Candidatus Binatus soli]|uniref:alpha-amylase family glycosyl hydrolase n=1 Tax=Candidatus Binatus soli TaxID=1953413 RepID=UPI003D130EE9